jgi:hypothetical protein
MREKLRESSRRGKSSPPFVVFANSFTMILGLIFTACPR